MDDILHSVVVNCSDSAPTAEAVILTTNEAAQVQATWLANTMTQEATQYQYQRAAAYPSVGDQLGALWILVNQLVTASAITLPAETATIAATIAAVREQFPAPANVPTTTTDTTIGT